jgi:hypothetical protein
VALFIDGLPFHSWIHDTHSGSVRIWSVSVQALPVGQLQGSAGDRPPQRWKIDTGCSGDAFAWRLHLEGAGLNPATQLATPSSIRTAGGGSQPVLVRKADLLIFSNIPGVEPFRLELNPGIPFINSEFKGGPDLCAPVIGLQALRRARLTVKIDHGKEKLWIWTPDPWYRAPLLHLRRAFSLYRTLPSPW